MKKLFIVLSLIALTLGLCIAASGTTEYVVVNDNNYQNNFVTIFRLDTSSGALTQVALLSTDGAGLGPFQTSFANIEQAISPNASCVFALNAITNDIAAFSKALAYGRVGNYSQSALDSSAMGGSLTLTPNGKFLYSSYSASGNVAAWAVNADCSLTFIASYLPLDKAQPSVIRVTPNGKGLIVSSPTSSAELFSINSSTGALNDLGYATFCTPEEDCSMYGVDVTRDSQFAVFALNYGGHHDYLIPLAIAARISTTGIKGIRLWNIGYGNPPSVTNNNMPLFSSAGYSGSGNLYFGAMNGVITTNFTEAPLSLTVMNSTLIDPSGIEDGTIAIADNILVQAQFPGQVGVFSINPDGSLSQLSTSQIESANPGAFSLSIYPETR